MARRLTMAELARELGVSKGTVSKWKKKGMPLEADGRVDPDRVQAWRQGGGVRKRSPMTNAPVGEAMLPEEASALADDEEGKKALTAYRKAKAVKEMLIVKELKGELVPLAEIDDLLVRRAIEFRRGLEAIENALPGLFPEVAARLKKELHDRFRDLLARYSRSDRLLEGRRKKPKKRKRT